MNKFNFDIVIVGGGISGSYLAHKFTLKGLKTIILEKSNKLGGRLSTKSVGSNLADYGCQYLNPYTKELKKLVKLLEQKSLLHAVEIEPGKYVYVSSYGMNKIPQYLALGVPVITNELVKQIILRENRSCKVITKSLSLNTKLVVLTMPIKQVSSLLENSNIMIDSLPKSRYKNFYTSTFISRISQYKNIVNLNQDMPWICNNTLKGLRNKEVVYTVNFSDKISEDLAPLSSSDRKIKIKEILHNHEFTDVNHISSHYWKYAYNREQKNRNYIFDKKRNIGICGDSFSVGRVDGAVKSSELIFRKIISSL